MSILVWVIGAGVLYFFVVFVGLRLVAPFMGFGQYRPPANIPREIKDKITELEVKSTDQKSYLEAVYPVVLDKTLHQWQHTRFKAAVRLPRLFVKDLQEIWQTKGFLYCTAINYVGYTMLVKSKYFTPDQVKAKHVFANFAIHQYLQVKVGETWADFDPAGTGIRGKPLGSHLSLFG